MGGRRHLTDERFATLDALCDTVLPQPDRPDAIPLAAMVDRAIGENRTTGTRYATLPPMREAWERALDLLEAEAQALHARPFATLSFRARGDLLHRLDAGETAADWGDLPPQEVLRKVILDQITRAYYAHPSAWSEIGFGGPASPRGYVRLAADRRDAWEAPEGRFG